MSVVYDWVPENQVKFFMDFVPEQLRKAYENEQQLMIYGIVEDHVAVGAAVVHVMEPESILNYIYVAPDYRGRGLCGECLANLGYALWQAGVYWVTARYIPKDHPVVHALLLAGGAWENPAGCGSFRFSLKEVKDNKIFTGSTEGVFPLSGCTEAELTLLSRRIRQKGFVPVQLPISPADYEADCSCVYRKNGQIEAILLAKRQGEEVELPFVYSDAESPAVFLVLMRFAMQEGLKRYPGETVCTLRSVDEPMTKLLEKLLERPMEEEAVRVTWPLTSYDEYHRQFMEMLMEEPMDLSDLAEEPEAPL